jgi:hypothetical protein
LNRGNDMTQQIMDIVKDLLDDRNIILYVLFVLALYYPDLAEIIAGGILGYWAKGALPNKGDTPQTSDVIR